MSLISAMEADVHAADGVKTGKWIQLSEKYDPPNMWIYPHPEQYRTNSAFCFSVYVDAGSADVRSLGPCLSSAIAGDFFGVIEKSKQAGVR